MNSELIKKFANDHKGNEVTKLEGNFSSLAWGTLCLLTKSPFFPKYYEGDFGSLLLLLEKGKGIMFLNFDNYKEATKQALESYIDEKKKFEGLKDLKELREKINETYEKDSPESIKKLSDEDLEKLILYSFDLLRDWQAITLFAEALDESILKEYFEKIETKTSFEEFFNKSSLVDFESYVLKKKRSILETGTNQIYDIQWAFANYIEAPKIEECKKIREKFVQESGGESGLKEEIEKDRKEVKNNEKEVQQFRKNLNKKEKSLFDFMKEVIFIRDSRKKDAHKCITLLSNSVREFLSRRDINENLVSYTMHEDFVKQKYNKENFERILNKRNEGFQIYFGNKDPEIESVDFEKAKQEVYRKAFGSGSETEEIKGNIANKGHAKGKAKIVLSNEDFDKFEEGDILVTSMTRPEFVPLIKKSSAIITDEGGLTCHAAIVSRELNKPCIIGTKKATNDLEDGLELDVNANEGKIKILDNKK